MQLEESEKTLLALAKKLGYIVEFEHYHFNPPMVKQFEHREKAISHGTAARLFNHGSETPVHVGRAYCSVNDNAVFSKQKGRVIALARALKETGYNIRLMIREIQNCGA